MSAYGDNDSFKAWVDAQGLALPDDANLSALRLVGSNYVDAAYEYRLSCSHRAGGFEQERAWPRSGHRVNGQLVPDNLVPLAWVNASYRAAYLQAMNPEWATGSIDPNRITRREKVDVIEREFFSPNGPSSAASASGMASDAVINGMVLPWLCVKTRRADSLFRVV